MHPRLRSHPIHHVPVHGARDRLGDISWDVVAIHRKILRSLFGQMPGPPKLRLEIIENRPAYIVQEFGYLAGVIDEDVVVEPLEKVLDRQIGLLLAYRMASRLEQLAEAADIARETSQIVLSDVTAHLDVEVA